MTSPETVPAARRYRVGFLETHPIQYKAPWFRALAAEPWLEATVFYCMQPDARQQGAEFGVAFSWDVPLLDGYRYQVLRNVARRPDVTTFRGCDTPCIRDIVRRGPAATTPGSNRTARRRWDAFVVNGWRVTSAWQTLLACRRCGVPVIVRGESNNLRPRAAWKRLVHRALLRQYAAVLAIGRLNRAFYLERGVSENRIFCGPYCVDNERFARAAGDARWRRAALRRRWSIPESAFCFLFSGKLIPKKRPLDLLQALAVLPGAAGGGPTPGVHALVVGDGPLREACEARVAQGRLPATFAGFLNQSEMPEAYAADDCLVLPSDWGETWGLVVNEAMACGLPAVVSDQVGCHADLVEPGRTGWVYACGQAAELADRMARAAADPAQARAMGAEAANHVRAYSVGRLVQGTAEAVRFVAGEGVAPGVAPT